MTIPSIKLKINIIIIIVTLYAFYLLGFFLNEDSNGGATMDYMGYKTIIYDFILNFNYTFLNFDQYGERHPPTLIIILSFLYKLNIEDNTIRLISLNFSIISIIFFYKCLVIKFKNIDKKILVLISAIFLLSPSFRSLSIWPDGRIYGFHFFVISTFFYLKFIHEEKKNYFCYLNIIFIAISSYFSPNFSLSSIFFLYQFYKNLKISKETLICILLNLILAFPAFYYLFVLDVFFLSSGRVPGSEIISKSGLPIQYNISNKILIITSIIMFYLIPIMLIKKKLFIYDNYINLKRILFLTLFFLLMVYEFNYELNFTGGGIFLHLSHRLFENNIIFYLISLFSIFFVFRICSYKYDNFFIILIIFLSNPQLSIYHKYYDPLITFLIFTLVNVNLKKSFFNYKNVLIIYLFHVLFLGIGLLKGNNIQNTGGEAIIAKTDSSTTILDFSDTDTNTGIVTIKSNDILADKKVIINFGLNTYLLK